MLILRLWDRNTSVNEESSRRASSSSRQIGAPLTFPLVMTRAGGTSRPSLYVKSRICTGAYGSMTPSVGLSAATDGAIPQLSLFLRRRIGF